MAEPPREAEVVRCDICAQVVGPDEVIYVGLGWVICAFCSDEEEEHACCQICRSSLDGDKKGIRLEGGALVCKTCSEDRDLTLAMAKEQEDFEKGLRETPEED